MDDALPHPDPALFLAKMAEDARKLLPASNARLEKLQMMLTAERLTNARLQQVATMDGSEVVKTDWQPIDQQKMGEYLMKLAGPVGPQTNAKDKIFHILLINKDGEGLKVPEIQSALKGVELNVADSTLYAYLREGKNEGLLKNESSRWALTDEGVKYALGMDLT